MPFHTDEVLTTRGYDVSSSRGIYNFKEGAGPLPLTGALSYRLVTKLFRLVAVVLLTNLKPVRHEQQYRRSFRPAGSSSVALTYLPVGFRFQCYVPLCLPLLCNQLLLQLQLCCCLSCAL